MNNIYFVVIAFLLLIVLLSIIVSKKSKKGSLWGSKSEHPNWNVSDSGSKFRIPRGIEFLIVLILILFDLLIYSPAMGDYITLTRAEPLITLFMVYLPLFAIVLFSLSVIFNNYILAGRNIKLTFSIVFTYFSLALWLPVQIITTNCMIYTVQGYRASPAFIVFSVWERLIGIHTLEYSIVKISLAWILTYIFTSIILILILMIIVLTMRKKSKSKGLYQ